MRITVSAGSKLEATYEKELKHLINSDFHNMGQTYDLEFGPRVVKMTVTFKDIIDQKFRDISDMLKRSEHRIGLKKLGLPPIKMESAGNQKKLVITYTTDRKSVMYWASMKNTKFVADRLRRMFNTAIGRASVKTNGDFVNENPKDNPFLVRLTAPFKEIRVKGDEIHLAKGALRKNGFKVIDILFSAPEQYVTLTITNNDYIDWLNSLRAAKAAASLT